MQKESIPATGDEQLCLLTSNFAELDAITCRFHCAVIALLQETNIPYILSEWRTKTTESTVIKNQRFEGSFPLTDIHGIRIVLEEKYKKAAIDRLQQEWPTPQNLPWGPNSVRVYPQRGEFDFENPKKLDYSATHLNLYIPEGARIAEIQLFTPEQYIAAEMLRPGYDHSERKQLWDWDEIYNPLDNLRKLFAKANPSLLFTNKEL